MPKETLKVSCENHYALTFQRANPMHAVDETNGWEIIGGNTPLGLLFN